MIVVVLAAFIAIISAQAVNCSMAATCSQCNQVMPNSCGWCSATQSCMPGSITGPTSGKCVGRGQWVVGACPQCSDYNADCRGCTLNNRDCGWCENNKVCVDISNVGVCGVPQTTCPCHSYQNCAQCTVFSDNNCAWCSKSQSCHNPANINATLCGPLAHDCPCSVNRNCDACLQDFNAVSGTQHVECQWCLPAPGQRDRNESLCQTKGQCPTGQLVALNCPTACASYGSDCRRCQERGCAFCGNTQTCADPDTLQAGPGSGCFVAHQCPPDDCERRGSCDMCRSEGCTWCFDHQVCTSRNSTVAQSCKVDAYPDCRAACAAQKSCDACEAQTGCGWCKQNDTTTCIDKGFHRCEGTVVECGGFAVGTFFLGWLVLALILGLVAGGFFIYRRRSGRPVYTSI